MSAVPRAVPSAVAPSTANSVPVLTGPNLTKREMGPYAPGRPDGKVNPQVPRTETEGEPLPSPRFAGYGSEGAQYSAGSAGAPSVPVNGFLYTQGPIDEHYTSEFQRRDPYSKVNNPPTRGMWTRVQSFLNGIKTSQDTDNAGWQARHPQQRTSVMRNQLPSHGGGYAPETFTPHSLPQRARINYIGFPVQGSDQYGSGVLNSDTFGAGQTAGGIGGNNYTPVPGPPATTSTADSAPASSPMPTWG